MRTMAQRTPLLAALLLLAACSSETTTDRPSATTGASSTEACRPPAGQRDVAYVDGGGPLRRLDLYLPDDVGCAPVPLVVWVHGGGWRTGDKANAMADKVVLWNDAGWAVASVDYRLTDTSVPVADRVVAPTHNEDVASAIGWLIDRADDLGIDPDHLAVLGHSAGAGIVAALATDPGYLDAVGLEPIDLGCVAPLDTEAFSIEAAVGTGPVLGKVYADAFGTDPARWTELSPLTHVGEAPIPPLLLVTRGTPLRREIVGTFADAVEASGGRVTIIDLPTFSHEEVNKRIGDPTDGQLTPALQDFLTTCLTR